MLNRRHFLSSTAGVVVNGRYLDHPALDRMLATPEKMARSGEHDLIHRPRQGRPLK
jgi:hypothetical protein